MAAGLPDADTDVLIWDSSSPEAKLGAYIGHDDLGHVYGFDRGLQHRA